MKNFVYVIVIMSLGYFIFLSSISLSWKAVCIAAYFIIIAATVFSLMLENRSAQSTLLWIYILVLVPVAGYVFYVYSGQLFLKGYLFKNKRRADRELFEQLPQNESGLDRFGLNEHQRCFIRYLERVTLTHTSTNTQTKILENGGETFDEIKRQLKKAKEFIHMEYYTFRYDRLGKELVEILKEKVKEGVAVRLLYDAVGSFHLTSSDLKEMKDFGIKVYPFLPIKKGFFNQKFNFRNHRKIIVIDGKAGFVGGLNVGVEYLGQDEKIGFWRDTHVFLEGEAVQTLHTVFLSDWMYTCGESLLDHLKDRKPRALERDGLVHVVATGPETRDMSDHFYTMMACASKSIWIASPYFVPNQAIRTALRTAAAKGIEVRIIVPEINDGFLTQYATRSYFEELLRAGIEIYSYQKGFLHKKIIIVDGDMATIGTANMDMRSFHLNFEVNLFLTGTKSIEDLTAHFKEDLNDCQRVRLVEFYKRSKAERAKESFARLFSGIL